MARNLTLWARLGLDGRKFEQGLKKAGLDAKRFGSQIGSTLAGAFSVAFIKRAALDTIRFSRSMASAAESAGVTSEQMQELAFAAKTVGVTVEQLQQAFKGIANARKQALLEGEGGRKLSFFEQIGISEADLRGARDPHKLFLSVARGIGQIRNEITKVGVASELFEETGVTLIPLFNKNVDSLTQSFRDMGLAIEDIELQKLDRLGGSLENMDAVVAKSLAPALALVEQRLQNVADISNAMPRGEGTRPGDVLTGVGKVAAGSLDQFTRPVAIHAAILRKAAPLLQSEVFKHVSRFLGVSGAGARLAGVSMARNQKLQQEGQAPGRDIGQVGGGGMLGLGPAMAMSMMGLSIPMAQFLKSIPKQPVDRGTFTPPSDSLARIGGFVGRTARGENVQRQQVSLLRKIELNTDQMKEKLRF